MLILNIIRWAIKLQEEEEEEQARRQEQLEEQQARRQAQTVAAGQDSLVLLLTQPTKTTQAPTRFFSDPNPKSKEQTQNVIFL